MRTYTLVILLLLSGYSYSQYSVSGQILDKTTQEPVIGATIYFQEPEKGTITDFDGNFLIEGLSKGEYNVIISSLGYGTRTLRKTVSGNETMEVFLAPTAIEMEEVIISTPFHQLQSENVMKVARATMESLSRTGAMDLSQGITKIAGVSSVSTGAGIGKPVIRGLSGNRVLVYTQGVRLENQQFGAEHGLGVGASGIESVEVIKGPASLLYGSDALGGVLYLNPEKFAPTDSTMVDFSTGYFTNTQGVEGNAGIKTSTEHIKFLFRGNYFSHADYRTGSGQRVTNSRHSSYDIKTGLGVRAGKYKGNIRYNLNAAKTGIPEGILGQSRYKSVTTPYQQVTSHILSLDNTFYLDRSTLDVTLGYLFNDRKEFEEHHEEEPLAEPALHEGEPALDMDLETINYDIKYHVPEWGNLKAIIGLQGMYQSNLNHGEEILIPDAYTTDVGILSTFHYHMEILDLQAGLRYDYRNMETKTMGDPSAEKYFQGISRGFRSYNGAFGIKADISPQLTTRLNLATGFRAPNLAELTSNGTHHGSNRYEIGNSSLENEQNVQIDFSLEYGNEHVEVFGNGFYNRINNYIYLDPTGEVINEDPVFRYAQHNANLYGGEAGIHFHPHPLDWLHYESSYELVIGKRENGNYLPLIPAPSLLNTLRIEFPDQKKLKETYTSVSLETVFDKEKPGMFETATPGYSLLSAGIGGAYDMGGSLLHVQVSGNNLLDKAYISHLSRLKPDGIENMGRNLSIRLRLSF